MRAPGQYAPLPGHPRLLRRGGDRYPVLYTVSGADPPIAVYGERLVARGPRVLRHWDPHRSKLGAALAKDEELPLPAAGERWLYLGAATGTTASHVADLVLPGGLVAAVERSLRPFSRLLRNAEAYPNLLPILGDARRPEAFAGDAGRVDGLYQDIAQPDQVDILVANARLCLRIDGVALLALKTASLGRALEPRAHLRQAEEALEQAGLEVVTTVGLEPFHKRHYLIAAKATRALSVPTRGTPTARPPSGRRAGRRP